MAPCNFSDPRIDEGIRLFNAREFFDCHDVLEDFWGELTCPERPFFQGLIQAAVALFHFEEGNLGGARRMSVSSRAYMSPFTPVLGRINVERLLLELDACFAELCQPHQAYPNGLTLDSALIPMIHRIPDQNDNSYSD